MDQELYVLFARPYDFTDKETGEKFQGVTIYYLNNIKLDSNREGYGYQPIKATVKNMDCFEAIPGFYHAHFDITSGAKGLQLRLSSLRFEKAYDIWAANKVEVNE